ncbi:MAG: MarR family winged helix-turn-helix transcriptional regulator [Clostridia bacterium]|nr:MarR family winged helix-turn-helix transcriptional regulator [Clostridia bacterium]
MEKSIGLELRSVNNQIKRYLNTLPVFQSNEVSGIYGYVIGYIYRNSDKDVFQKDIEEEFSIRRSSVTNLLCQMEKYGLIERLSVSGDGRLKKVVLTKKAVDMQLEIEQGIAGVEEKLKKGLSDSEQEQLFKLLAKLKSNLTATDN